MMAFRNLLALFLFTFTTSAIVIPRQSAYSSTDPCCFSLYAQSSTVSGLVEEDTIGENRILGSYPQGAYCVSPSTGQALLDAQGHNCLIQPSSLQFQCVSAGVRSTNNFTITPAGLLQHDGSSMWTACPAAGPGMDGSYNLFSDKVANGTGCVAVSLQTGGFSCAAEGRPSTTSSITSLASVSTAAVATQSSNAVSVQPFTTAATTPTSAPASSSVATPIPTDSACPTNLERGAYLRPNLIVPVASGTPDQSYGTVYSPLITRANSTIFGFDVPSASPYTGDCALLFLFPYDTSTLFTYNFTGIEEEVGEHGGLNVTRLMTGVSTSTTYNSAPQAAHQYGVTEIIPGNNYTIATFPCPGMVSMAVEFASAGDVGLQYFQTDAPAAIGAYVVPCGSY